MYDDCGLRPFFVEQALLEDENIQISHQVKPTKMYCMMPVFDFDFDFRAPEPEAAGALAGARI